MKFIINNIMVIVIFINSLSIQLARDLLYQWCCVRQQGQTMSANNNNNNVCWQPPVTGTVKCNIDAALFNDQQKFGVGMCIRNDQGNFMKAKTMWFHGTPPPQEAEAWAWALRECMFWLGELYSCVVIELDCLLVVNAITDNSSNQTEFGYIMKTCRELLQNYQNFEIVYVKRQANFVAHSLARASKFYARSQLFDSIPSCIATTLLNEII
jgi:hypothetical protein